MNINNKRKIIESSSDSDSSDSDYESSSSDYESSSSEDEVIVKKKTKTTTFSNKKVSYSTLEKSCNTFKDSWPQWRKDLFNKGWAVVPGVLSEAKCKPYRDSFWKWLEDFETGVVRDDPTTWTNDKWPGNIHGIFQHYSFGQNQFVWDIRSEEAIIDVFNQIYNTNKLLVSFDGGNLSRPTKREAKPWPHFDQGSHKFGFRCVQGFLNLNNCQDDMGGLIVYEGSHLLHDKYFKETGIDTKGDWWKFEKVPDYFKKCKKIKVNCNIGDIVLWDSRTIHFACAPTIPDIFRMVVYVSYQPVSLISDKDLEKKKKCFKEKRMTSHWASENIKMFPKNPRTYGNNEIIEKFKVDVKTLPILSKRAKQLAGLIPY